MGLPKHEHFQPSYDAPDSWMTEPVKIVLIGAGGNGSEVVDCLASFHHALISLGHKHGIHLTVIDDATVRAPNLVRQRFWPCDLGQNKAVALVNRFNLMLGLDWNALPHSFPSDSAAHAILQANLIITAVDVASARRAVGALTATKRHCMWLDLGNSHRHGQVVFGALHKDLRKKYPTVQEVFPELESMPDDNQKSCSAAESLASQDCLVNRAVTTAGMSVLWDLLRYGSTTKHCISVNLATGEQMVAGFPCS